MTICLSGLRCVPIMALIAHIRSRCLNGLNVCDACHSYPSPLTTILLPSSPFLTAPLMSHNHSSSTLSNFQLIFDNALEAYKKRTGKDLLEHPLADRLQACDSPNSILTVLQEQVQELNESQCCKERLTKWLEPTVNVLYAFSGTLGEGVGLVSIRT
jgi:hypothetical protein